jgi:hypothetical protein
MSAMNPQKDLEKVITLTQEGRLPADAERWAEGASRTAEEIRETVRAMKRRGADAPTHGQREALANICAAARRWIKAAKEPEGTLGKEAGV